MVLTRFHVKAACSALFCLVLLQAVVYKELWKVQFLCRNLSLLGSLFLVVAESLVEEKAFPVGLPSLGENCIKKYLLLAGRILMLFMFEMVLRFDMTSSQILQNIVGTIFMLLFAIGFKTRLSALVMVIWMASLNFYLNPWWNITTDNHVKLLLQYEFFQRFSVIGGLLMVVHLGAGGVSVDEQKKQW